ncbi:pseudouridylate synthase / pseudouridine kinase [Entomortierella parvispora]|uniref:Pseudouridylate synthase / pseudouridine kinase n=1 Tax=Entomortierella parvispora TaxID=205924 RepID=A0A9P3HH38_9FUNG|nr:pseudouridylate synthase / pseudouridine kinase [Entomortierella parvispora]
MLRAAISLRLNQVPKASLSSAVQWSRHSSHASRGTRPLSTLSTLSFSDEVRSALDNKKPLVALESTIISHGMPYPQNYETAIEVEKVVRDNGAIPATIAILDGQIQIGLSHDQIRKLAKLGRGAVKASRRDLAVVLSKKQTGATTVSATMILAHRAGIPVFATGGIGGVHRGYENSLDASADLTELGRTPVAVVCAGVKSILDIGKTLEFLETQGVTVATYGSTPDFPAFFTRTSGFKSMLNIETPLEAAELIAANHSIDLQSGIVIGVPIAEIDAMDDRLVGEAIDLAVRESNEQGIFGKESTPFLLKRVNELTGGNSLKSNIALVKQNASVAAKIAKDLSSLNSRSGQQTRSFSTSARRMKQLHPSSQRPIMVIGGTVVDITSTATAASSPTMLNSSHPGATRISLGGVGRNVAEGISALSGEPCVFVSAVGGQHVEKETESQVSSKEDASDDLFGPWLISELARRGMDNHEIHVVPGARTATYTAVHDATGNLLSAVADMDVFEMLPPAKVKYAIEDNHPGTVCFDGNLSVDCMRTILETCRDRNILTFFEPTSVAKCTRVLDSSLKTLLQSNALNFASPNEYELAAMGVVARELLGTSTDDEAFQKSFSRELNEGDEKQERETQAFLRDAFTVSLFIPTLFIKLGSKGVFVVDRVKNADTDPSLKRSLEKFPAHAVEKVESVTGAGDSFVASVVTSLHQLAHVQPLLSSSDSEDENSTVKKYTGQLDDNVLWKHIHAIVEDGQKAAILTMQTHQTVSSALAHCPQAERVRRQNKLLLTGGR